MHVSSPHQGTPARSPRTKYMFIGFKLMVLLIVAVNLTAFKCGGGGCKACVCQETKKIRVALMYQGQTVVDILPGSTLRLFVSNALGNQVFLADGLLTFGPGEASASVDLTTPIPKENMVDSDGNIRNPPDAAFAAYDDKICSTEGCSPNLHWRYLLLNPPAVDYDFSNCEIILRFNTTKICTFCP